MDNQATVNGPRANGQRESVVQGIAGFGSNVTNLAELQIKLFSLDLKEGVQRAAIPTAVCVAAFGIVVGGVPVALTGVAMLISTLFVIPLGWALLLTSAVSFGLSALIMAAAGLRIYRSFDSFQRSKEELNRNLSWIRTVLAYSGRPAPRRWF